MPETSKAPPIYRSVTLKYDVANDMVEYENHDEMTYLEIMGLIKYAELMMAAEVAKGMEFD